MREGRNNKGFTLIEVIIAIALLAICITPAMQSFITSAIVNKQARQVMYATEVGETINEGFANKNYMDVQSIVGFDSASGIDTMDLEGRYLMSSISDNVYNKSANAEKISTFNNVVSINQATMDYDCAGTILTSVSNGDVISGNAALPFNQKNINEDFYSNVVLTKYVSGSFGGTTEQKFYYWVSDGGLMTCVCYSNVQYGPYLYDVVVSFIPTARDDDPKTKYYSYSMCTSVYRVSGSDVPTLDALQATYLLQHNADEAIQPEAVLYTGMRGM